MKNKSPFIQQIESKEYLRNLIDDRYPEKTKREKIKLGYRFKNLHPDFFKKSQP